MQTKTFRTYNNNKPCFTPKVGRQGSVQAGNSLTEEIRVAKRSNTEELRNSYSANNIVSLERPAENYGLQETIPPPCGTPAGKRPSTPGLKGTLSHPSPRSRSRDSATGSITSTPQVPTQGSCLWTSVWRITPLSPRSSTRSSPSSLCQPPPVSGSPASRPSTDGPKSVSFLHCSSPSTLMEPFCEILEVWRQHHSQWSHPGR